MPLRQRSAEPMSLSELVTDPHFLFTIISLIASLCVFFYYLFQLLFRTDGFRPNGNTFTPPSSRRASQDKAKVDPALAKKDDDLSLRNSGTTTDEAAPPPATHVKDPAKTLAHIQRSIDRLRDRSERRREMLGEWLAAKEAEVAAEARSRATTSDPVTDGNEKQGGASESDRQGSHEGETQAREEARAVPATAVSGGELRKRRTRKEE